MIGMPYIPCHLGLKRLDPSGWQMSDPRATICLSNKKNNKNERQHKQPSINPAVKTPTILQLLKPHLKSINYSHSLTLRITME